MVLLVGALPLLSAALLLEVAAGMSPRCTSLSATDAVLLVNAQNDFMEERTLEDMDIRAGKTLDDYNTPVPVSASVIAAAEMERHAVRDPVSGKWKLGQGILMAGGTKEVPSVMNKWAKAANAAKSPVIAAIDWHHKAHCSFCRYRGADGVVRGLNPAEGGLYCISGFLEPPELFTSHDETQRCQDVVSQRDWGAGSYYEWPDHGVAGTFGGMVDPWLDLPSNTTWVKLGYESNTDSFSAFDGGKISTIDKADGDRHDSYFAQADNPCIQAGNCSPFFIKPADCTIHSPSSATPCVADYVALAKNGYEKDVERLRNSPGGLTSFIAENNISRLFIMGIGTEFIVKNTLYDALGANDLAPSSYKAGNPPSVLKTVALIDAGSRGIVPPNAEVVKKDTVKKGGYVLFANSVNGALMELCNGTCDTHADCGAGSFCSKKQTEAGFNRCLPCSACTTGTDSFNDVCPSDSPNRCLAVLCRSDLGHFVANNAATCKCGSDGSRRISFAWVNPRKNNGELLGSKDCNAHSRLSSDGSMLTEIREDCPYVPVDSSLAQVISGLCIFSAVTALLWVIVVVKFRKRPAFKMGQPVMLGMCAFGAAILSVAPLTMIGEPSDISCQLVPWVFCIGFTVMFAPLFLKVIRVWKIYTNSVRSMRKYSFSVQDVVKWIGCLIAIDVVLLLVGQFTSGAKSALEPRKGAWDVKGVYVDHICTLNNDVVGTVLILYRFGLVLFGCFGVFKARNMPAALVETQSLALCLYNILLIGIILLFLVFMGDLSASNRLVVVGFCINWVTLSTPGLLLLPKLMQGKVQPALTNNNTANTAAVTTLAAANAKSPNLNRVHLKSIQQRPDEAGSELCIRLLDDMDSLSQDDLEKVAMRCNEIRVLELEQ